jgi:hypothetical protein
MTEFKRFTDPGYNLLGGAFPGPIGDNSYDLVNKTSGGTGAGGSAPVDGAAPGYTLNPGTFFIAFKEDALAHSVNRGLAALSKNTDAIDDILRSSLPYMQAVSVTVTGSPSADVAVTGDVFVGEYLAADTAENRARLLAITNTDGTPVLAVSNQFPKCTLIHDGSGVNVLGTSVDGFVNGATFRFDGAIAPGTYLFYVGRRTSYGDIQETKAGQLVSSAILGKTSENNLWSNFGYGLDDKYRKSTQDKTFTSANDVPGSGALITRDGKALTVHQQSRAWESPRSALDDEFNAGFSARTVAALTLDPGATSFDNSVSGNIGFLFLTNQRSTTASGQETSPPERPLAGFAVYNPMSTHAVAYNTELPYTSVPAAASAKLNPSGAGGNRVQLQGVADYFRTGGNTGLLLKMDMLLVGTIISGSISYRSYVIESIVDDKTVTVMTTGGATPAFAADTVAFVQWVQYVSAMGGTSMVSNAGGPVPGHNLPAIGYVDPDRNRPHVAIGSTAPAGTKNLPPSFVSASATAAALTVGYFSPLSGSWAVGAWFTGDGSYMSNAGRVQSALSRRSEFVAATDITRSGVTALNTLSGPSCLYWRCTAATGAGSTAYFYFDSTRMTAGDTFTLFIHNLNGASIYMMVDGVPYVFSGNDHTIPQVTNFVVKYDVTYMNNELYFTRTDYQL